MPMCGYEKVKSFMSKENLLFGSRLIIIIIILDNTFHAPHYYIKM